MSCGRDLQNEAANFADEGRMIGERVRVVIADESAIDDLLRVIFPVFHVARPGRAEHATNSKRRANRDCEPK